ncbi:MAG: iron-siderophore ABC transporter substrate-binding protein [Solobacterium sp.]|nr:iron-siderophore ABC transporter substrate-binding protein [Solobacterium sp.]
MRRSKSIAAVCTAAVLLTGCSSSAPAATAVPEAEEAFAEITHVYGTTVIPSEPQRIVALYDSNPDPVLALGIAPVGVSKTGYGVVDEHGLPPWTAAAFADLGVEPNVFDDTDGLDFEAINDAAPDLILAPNSGMTEEEYQRLSEIAPTVPYRETAYATTWKEEMEVTAQALGREAEGAEIIAETQALIDAELAKYPALEGKTAAFCWIDPSDLSVIYIYLPLDPRAGFLEEIGLELPQELKDMAAEGDFAVTLSSENIDMLNSVDIIVCYGEESIIEELQANPVINTVPAVRNGAIVPISSTSELYIGTYVTVLSIPAVIDQYIGMLGEAATKAEQ